MATKVEQKIVGYKVKPLSVDELPKSVKIEILSERDDNLTGATYKIRPVGSDHAWYVTINDFQGKPYEIFINTKDVAHFQWVQIMTRLISAIWRHGGKSDFVIEEMLAVVNPEGGYFVKNKGFQNSLVAHIGLVIKEHIAMGSTTQGGSHA